MTKETSSQKGVYDAWACYLWEHDVSVPEIIETAIENAWTKFLDKNRDSILNIVKQEAGKVRKA